MTQLVPSDTTVAQAPEVAPKMPVPAAPPVIGTTLLDIESSAWAWVFLKCNGSTGPVRGRRQRDHAGRASLVVDDVKLIVSKVEVGCLSDRSAAGSKRNRGWSVCNQHPWPWGQGV
jgi:hypothetical protein